MTENTFKTQVELDRLDEIRDARRVARNAKSESRQMQMRGGLSPQQANLYYREAVESFLYELKPFADIDEIGLQFWTGMDDKTLGWVYAEPPPKDSPKWETGEITAENAGTGYDSLEREPLGRIDGLLDVIEAPDQFHHTYHFVEKVRYEGWKQHSATATACINRDILNDAYDWARQFANHIGLDIDPHVDEADPEMKYKYLE